MIDTGSKTPDSRDANRSVLDSPQLTFQPIDMDLMGDLHELIFRRCSLCNGSPQKRTSASDSQLIDLSVSLCLKNFLICNLTYSFFVICFKVP